jgi:site-specific DNA recombinase
MSETHSTIRAVGYHRMSDDSQEMSIPDQRKWLARIAPTERLQVVREFEDPAVPGDEIWHRPGFLALLAYCEEQAALGLPIEAIATWDGDRFSRADSFTTGACISKLIEAGTTRLFSSEGWTDEMDRVLYNLKQDLSKAGYSKAISKNVARAMAQRAQQGIWLTRPPYGYAIGPDGRLILGDPAIVEIVRWIFRQYTDSDDSLRGVADRLNERGIPGPAPRWQKDAQGKFARDEKGQRVLLGYYPWTRASVRNLLADIAYVGTYRWNVTHTGKYSRITGAGAEKVKDLPQRRAEQKRKGRRRMKPQGNPADAVVLIPGEKYVPRIIDDDTFAAAARKMQKSRSRTGGGLKRDRNPFLMSGLLYCGDCGQVMWGGRVTRHRGSKVYVYHRYWCSTSQKHGKAACRRNEVEQDEVLGHVIRTIQERLGSPEAIAAIRQEVADLVAAEVPNLQAQRRQLEEKIAALDRQIDQGNTNLAVLPADLIPGVVAKVREWQKDREEAARQLSHLAAAEQSGPDLTAEVDEALASIQVLHELSAQEQPDLLRAALWRMVTKVTLHFRHDDSVKRKCNQNTFLTDWEVELDPDLVTLLGTGTDGTALPSLRLCGFA